MKPRHSERVPEYLRHIVTAIDRALSYTSAMDFAAFESDTRTQDAVIRSIQIVGEAANKVRSVDPDFAAQRSDIPWDLMYGMRNRIVHDYFEVDLEVVWQTVQRDLPVLRKQIETLLLPGQ